MNKHVLCLHQGSRERLRLRLRGHVMSWRPGETLHCEFNFPEISLRGHFAVLKELARKREVRTVDSLGRRETGVVFRRGLEP